MTRVIVCSFSSGLDDMKRKDQRDVVKVLRILAQCGRFSVFEATANQTIATMMDKILHKGCTLVAADGTKRNYGLLLKTTGGAFPWTEIELTAGGKQLLEDNPA
ncbi:hypothetical protein CHU94_08195 [Rhodoferax sp. TH121]|uniref:hypothetical protein n=1 Tax=Rhodoferax sp. TH121 TaxID=2022803 RepID=UPI000B9619DF|nr:hypothetical protein [Rhodoferax sp. TH121]OYQ41081.1 hypothetical protein CHU94_08195 [Rhodoferax sp. TH121]